MQFTRQFMTDFLAAKRQFTFQFIGQFRSVSLRESLGAVQFTRQFT